LLIINTIASIVIIMSETTTIQVTKQTRDELKKIGSMGDDYNAVIEKLIRAYKDHEHKSRIDRIAVEARKHFEENRDEYVNIDDL
jgi:hypothetical protein